MRGGFPPNLKPEDLKRKQGQKEYRAWAGDRIVTRDESAKAGQKYYFTGVPCTHGHVSLRYTKSNACLDCQTEACRKYNAEKRVIKAPDQETKDRKKLSRWLKRQDNLEEARRKDREAAQEWRKKNPGKYSEYNAPYRSNRKEATPAWLSKEHKEEMKNLVRERRRLTELTGTVHEVDHIYPVKGKTVCGLHVPWNMRVITKSENAVKWCKMPEEMEG